MAAVEILIPMLVKFLSFVASVLGSAGYKTILSCFAVVLSLTGVTAMAVLRDSQPADKSATSTIDKSTDESQAESTSPQLGSAHKQDAKDTTTNQSTTASSQAGTDSTTNTSGSQPQTPAQPTEQGNATNQAVDITAPSDITITAGNTSDTASVTAATSDQSTASWSAAIADGNDNIRIANPTASGTATFSFLIQADKGQAGKTVHLTVLARNTLRNTTISKQITVTIQ